ncbi:SufD family Fe-S cluster assembly protein [Mesoaciditoga lauensis]|uniref:SufD family Fe-S cluster assembly protein n=1 Tax=Mesoaciditoga lauensis TaxID=1495039 RepID=UPI00056B61CD
MQIAANYAKEFEKIAEAYEKSGGDASNLLDKSISSIIISGDKIIGLNTVKGVEIESGTREKGVWAKIRILKGYKIEKPIHLCTGFLGKEGEQRVNFDFFIEDGAQVDFISHCSFPWSTKLTHKMVANIHIGKNAVMTYNDEHFHSEAGGITLISDTHAVVEDGGKYENSFELTKTRVGILKVRMDVDLKKDAVAKFDSKIRGKEDDEISIVESLGLNGEGAHGIAKSTVVATDRTRARIINEAFGNAPYSKGHIECNEITKGDKVDVSTLPVLKVTNDLSELTHEASIGRVNSNQLNTLMAKGMSEDEATEFIIRGILR